MTSFLPYITTFLGLLCFIAFCVKCSKKRSVEGVFVKTAVSMFFIFTTAVGVFVNPSVLKYQYAIIILLGNIFGLLGDIFLDQKWVYPTDDHKYLVSGFTVFGIGHFFYIGAMGKIAQLEMMDFVYAALIGVLITVVNVILEKPSKLDYGKFKPIVIAYCLVIGTMTGTAFMCALRTKMLAFIICIIGAALFLLSDIVLSWIYFGEPKKNNPVNFVLNHFTYYAGQYMIALSVALLPVLS